MTTILSGPMFEPARHNGFKRVETNPHDNGSHYSVWHFDCGPSDRVDGDVGMQSIRSMFPNAEANDENFVIFSTSGVHGSYTTIEEIEAGLRQYGDDFDPGDQEPEGWRGCSLTLLIVQPRIVCVRCGNVTVRLADIDYLKKLRATSAKAMQEWNQP